MARTEIPVSTAITDSSALRTSPHHARPNQTRSLRKDRRRYMCGIAGIVGATRENNITEDLVREMCNRIIHRGPDDEGIFVEDGAGLGMRRLSIIDLSG